MKDKITKVEQMSIDRKESIKNNDNPEWLTTPGYQMIYGKYLTKEDNNLKKTFKRISQVCASHMKKDHKQWSDRFFDMMWNGDLALSTPVLSNLGTDKGMPVSCSNNYVPDSVHGFYESTLECAVLSQEGFGTSSYLGDIRPRGTEISRGGTASGVLPVIKQFVQMSRDITQGTRRGAWAGYLEISHDDFWEVVNYLEHNPEDLNLGWIIPDSFIDKLKNNEEDALNRYKRALKVKLVTGKGYFAFIDRANRLAPVAMREQGLVIKSSQLCNEIFIHSDIDHSYTCILSSVNVANRDKHSQSEWDKIIFDSFIFLDCVASEFIEKAKEINGLEKSVKYTEKARSLGLGVLGFHTLLQRNSIPFGSIDANYLNSEIFKQLDEQTLAASQWLASEMGEPYWCKGYGMRNLARMAIAPNCQDPNNRIMTNDGVKSIYEILESQDESIQDIESKEPHWIALKEEIKVPTITGEDVCERIWYNGIHPTRTIEFEDGVSYTYTLNHKLLVLDENSIDGIWKKVGDITEDDIIMTK